MKLTQKLKDEYNKKICDSIFKMTGILLPDILSTFPSVSSAFYLSMRIDNNYAKILDKNCVKHDFYHKPNKDKIYSSKYLNDEQWNNLLEIEKNNEFIPELKEWNDLIRGNEEQKLKKNKNEQEIREIQLEFDDQITLEEIRKEYPGFFVRYNNTKLSFHQIYNTKNQKHLKTPKFEIKIKPVFRSWDEVDNIYNKKEFETKMNEVDY